MPNLIELIYSSDTHTNINEQALLSLLSVSRRHNNQTKISGMLTYDNACFVQLIEGEEKDVLALFERIKNDTRHYNIALLYQGKINERAFEDWSMAFQLTSPTVQKQLINTASIQLNKITQSKIKAGYENIGKELLLIFRESH